MFDWFDEGPDLYDEVTENPYEDETVLTVCPRCGGMLTVEPEDRSVGIFGDAVFCENQLPDGTDCLWGENEDDETKEK